MECANEEVDIGAGFKNVRKGIAVSLSMVEAKKLNVFLD